MEEARHGALKPAQVITEDTRASEVTIAQPQAWRAVQHLQDSIIYKPRGNQKGKETQALRGHHRF